MPTTPTILAAFDDVGASQGQLSSGAETDDTTPNFRVGVGSDAQVGDRVDLIFMGTTNVGSSVLTAQDIANGYVTITARELINGSHQHFSAVLTDTAGQSSAYSADYPLAIWGFVPPPSDAVSTSLTDGGVLKAFTGTDVWGRTVFYDQKYDGAGSPVGQELHMTGEDSQVGIISMSTVHPLAGGDFMLTFLQGQTHFPNSEVEIVDAAGSVVRAFTVGGLGGVWAGAHGGFMLQTTVFSPTQHSDFQAYDEAGNATSQKLQFFGPITSITSSAAGTIDVAWTDPDGQSHVTAIDPTQTSSLGNPAVPGVSVLDDAGPTTGAVTYGASTDDTTPTFRIFVNQTGEAGLQLSSTSGSVNLTVTSADVTRGYVDITPSAPLSEGLYSSQARVGDANGLASDWRPISFIVQSIAHQGTSGNDTETAAADGAYMTGQGGADVFVFTASPTGLATITDFAPGTDKIDVSALLKSVNYTGSDPFADGYLSITNSGGSFPADVIFDADGSAGGGGGRLLVELKGVVPSQVGQSDFIITTASPPPPPSGGQTLQGQSGGSNLVGGVGDDTLIGGSGPDTMTGAGGADHFVWNSLPWSPGHVTDFTDGTDRLDLSCLLAAAHYTGSDPVADGYVKPVDDGRGDTWLYFDSDGRGSADQWGTFVATLDHVSASQITSADLVGGTTTSPPPTSPPPTSPPPVSPPPPGSGQTLQGQPGGSNLTGGTGDDTLIGGSGPDTMTGGAGADHFAWTTLPWSPGHVTDFADGTDRLDLSGLLSAYHYAGTDPVGDGWVKAIDDGQGDTWLYFDTDGPGSGDPWGTFVTTLDHVAAGQITSADLTGGASPPPPPPPSTAGVTLHGQYGGSNLVGGAGDDTLIGGHGPDTMTGAGGADHFVFDDVIWQAGEVTDFTRGQDKIDLSHYLANHGYTGSDPIADGWVKLIDDGHGNTWLYFDSDGPGTADAWGTFVATLDGVSAASLTASDFIFH